MSPRMTATDFIPCAHCGASPSTESKDQSALRRQVLAAFARHGTVSPETAQRRTYAFYFRDRARAD